MLLLIEINTMRFIKLKWHLNTSNVTVNLLGLEALNMF